VRTPLHDHAPAPGTQVLLACGNLGAQFVGIDDVFVDLKQRHVVVEHLMQEDHEFD
jgi:hypothetical protein